MSEVPETPAASDAAVSRAEALAIAIHEQLNDSSVERLFGRNDKAKNAQARRIVWIPVGGTIDDPRQGGGRRPADGAQSRVQSCKDRKARIEAHIYAESYAETEALLDRLIAATCIVLPNQTFDGGYQDVTQEQRNEAGVTNRTDLIVLTLEVRLPVRAEVKELRPIVAFDHVCGTLQQDGSILPQPST